MLHPPLDARESRSEVIRGTREKESASRELEEPDIAEGRLADRVEANHLALIGLAKWFANVLFR